MAFYPYLSFDGDCRQAFTCYREIFGGELVLLTMSEMPLAETFFSPMFGMCVDRFGTPWIVNTEAPVEPS